MSMGRTWRSSSLCGIPVASVGLIVLGFHAWLAPVAALGADSRQAASITRALVSVTDADGAPVRGLQAVDFVVSVGGIDAKVVGVTTVDDPPAIVVIPEGFSRALISDARGVMRAIVDSARADFTGARIGLMVRDGASAPDMRDVTHDGAALEQELSHFFGHANTPLLDSILVASDTLRREPSARRVIIAVAMHGSPEGDDLVPSRIARAVRESGASLWVIQVGGGLPLGSSTGQVLAHVPIASGGRRVSSSLAAISFHARQTVAAIASQYAVEFRGPAGPSGSRPRIGVRRDGVTVLAANWPEGL